MDSKWHDLPAYGMIARYLERHINHIMKNPYSYFTYPFIDPSSAYDGNLWDWDTFWSAYMLMNYVDNESNDVALREKLIEHAKGNVLNLLSFQMDDGYIPMSVSARSAHGIYLIEKRKSGALLNMAKPFVCQQALLVSRYCGDFGWILPELSKLSKYFECYDRDYLMQPSGLYVWADDVMIGVDNDPCTFGRPRFSTANIYLNAYMVRELLSMRELLKAGGDATQAEYYQRKADKLVECIQAECWDQRDQLFYSVDVDIKTRAYDWFHVGLGVFWNTLPIKIRVWTDFLPMTVGIATKAQAEQMVRHMFDPETFLSPYGVRTLSRDEKMYNMSASSNPSNWLGAIWIIANYECFRALLVYGYREEAEEICRRTIRLLEDDLRKTDTLHEYYNADTGEPVINGDFVNWNILALNMMDELDGNHAMEDYLPLWNV